jgi:hypothetical protein
MRSKRVFKTRTFDRWAKKILTDSSLCTAAREIERGVYEADLGHGLCKKRVAVEGRGKSGSTRLLVAKRHADAIFFLVGRQKSDSGSDFSVEVVEVAKGVADALQQQPIDKIEQLVSGGVLKEICSDQEDR